MELTPNIQDLKNFTKTLPFIDRYFTRNYHKLDHIYYYEHSNGLILSGLSKEHPIIKEGLNIDKIEFLFKAPHKEMDLVNKDDNDRENGYSNLVSGKKKRGGIKITPNMKLFKITCQEKVFTIRSHVLAFIIEISPNLINKQYQMIQDDSEGSGYFFIANPPGNDYAVANESSDIVKINKTW